MAIPLPERGTRPDFAVSVRGYDRAQVDAYVGRVFAWLADAENRVASAERAREAMAREVDDLRAALSALQERAGLPAPQSMNAFSERMGQVMQSAVQAAEELRVQVEREAEQRRAALAQEAEETLSRARAEAELVVADARTAKRAVEDSISDLRAAQRQVVEELRALRERLSALCELADPTELAEPAHDAPAPLGTEASEPGTEARKPGTEARKPGAEASEPGTEASEPKVDEPEDPDPLQGLRRLSVDDAGSEESEEDAAVVSDDPDPSDTAVFPVVATATPTDVLPAVDGTGSPSDAAGDRHFA